jgi:CCR4-NOT transcriptional regulation complex NOT5 subunit
VGKYKYFDFENKWMQKVSGDDIEMDLNHIENELIV